MATATKKNTKAAVPAKKAAEAKPKGAGRKSAYAGKKIKKLKTTEETGLRPDGKVRECWNAIKDGITVDKYRENAPDSGLARKVLADFIAKGYVELV